MRRALWTVLCVGMIHASVRADTLELTFADPTGDNSGPIDVTEMVMTFDNVTGDYSIDLFSTAADPFFGFFRVNLNLFNPGAADDFFQDTFNDFTLAAPQTSLTLTGTDAALTTWNAGDQVVTSTWAGLGNPSGSTFFRSQVSSLPFGFLTNEDVIGVDDGARSGAIAVATNPVPEPSTGVLTLLGLLAAGLLARRKR